MKLPYATRGGKGMRLSPRLMLTGLALLASAFFSFLIFYVLAYHFRIQSDGIHTVAIGPKMIAPIRLRFERPEFVKNTNRGSTFNGANKVGYRNFRRHHRNQVNIHPLSGWPCKNPLEGGRQPACSFKTCPSRLRKTVTVHW